MRLLFQNCCWQSSNKLSIGYFANFIFHRHQLILSYRSSNTSIRRMIHEKETAPDFDTALNLLHSQVAMDSASIHESSLRRRETVQEMKEYMRRIGIPYKKIDNANTAFESILHVAGTKGKGSTCSMCEAILRHSYGVHTALYTSPHLVKVTERIRLDGKPISDEEFTIAYMEVRNRLLSFDGEDKDSLPLLPGYFRMLTLVAFFVFNHHQFDDGSKVDVTILETGLGGRYDATNAFECSDVMGITLLDFDHTRVLGNTIEEIAWEKSGILKKRTPHDNKISNLVEDMVFTVEENCPAAIEVITKCAAEQSNAKVVIVRCGEKVPPSFNIGLPGDHQRSNAELAVSMVEAWGNLRRAQSSQYHLHHSTTSYQLALEKAFWPGRCQTITREHVSLRCDGAHTEKSIDSCIQWFCKVSGYYFQGAPFSLPRRRILVFNCSHERNPVLLLQKFIKASKLRNENLFHQVYFCPSNSERPSMVSKSAPEALLQQAGITGLPAVKDGSHSTLWQDTLSTIWLHLEQLDINSETSDTTGGSRSTEVLVGKSVAEVLDQIEKNAALSDKPTEVLVTGSLYIVGSILEAAQWVESCASGALVIRNN